MRRQRIDRWLGILLVLFASGWSWAILETIPPAQVEGEAGPRGFPLLLGIVLGALGLYMTASAFLGQVEPETDDNLLEPVSRAEVRIVGLTILTFVGYAFLLDKLGFLVATPIMVVAVLRLIVGQRTWVMILLLAAGLTVGSYVIFGMLMPAHLPEGSWLQLLSG